MARCVHGEDQTYKQAITEGWVDATDTLQLGRGRYGGMEASAGSLNGAGLTARARILKAERMSLNAGRRTEEVRFPAFLFCGGGLHLPNNSVNRRRN